MTDVQQLLGIVKLELHEEAVQVGAAGLVQTDDAQLRRLAITEALRIEHDLVAQANA